MVKNEINLSIIVACYNVYPYIKDCLKSLVNVNYPKKHLEILLVDDGSTDQTSNITSKYALKYPFVHVYHRTNHGVCDTRNFGIKHANGKYFAFVDGDDTVPPDAYSKLMYNAEHTHSNIVAGFVRRFDNLRNVGSYLHKFAIQRDENHTTIAKSHNLLYDTTVWNKVYLRSFILRNHIFFNPKLLYEDLPFVLEAHLKSNNDSTISANVYNWRWRDNSVTNNRTSINNLKARLLSLNICKHELFNAGFGESSSLYKSFIYKVLRLDLNLFLENIGDNDESYIYKAQELLYKFLRDWTINGHSLLKSPLLKTLPVKNQVSYYALMSCNLPLLTKYTYVPKRKLSQFENIHIHRHKYISSIPKNVLKHINIHNNTLPVQQTLDALSVDDSDSVHTSIVGMGTFRIRNMRMIKSLFSANNYNERLSAMIVNLINGKHTPISIKRVKSPIYKRILRPRTRCTNAHYMFRFNDALVTSKIGYGYWRIKVRDVVYPNNDHKHGSPFIASAWIGQPNRKKNGLITTTHIKSDFTPRWTLEFYPIDYNEYNSYDLYHPTVTKHYFTVACSSALKHVMPVIKIDDNHFIKGVVINHRSSTQLLFDLRKWRYPVKSKFYHVYLVDMLTYYNIKYNCTIKPHYSLANSGVNICAYSTRSHNLRIAVEYQPLLLTDFKFSHKNDSFSSKVEYPFALSKHDVSLNHKYGKLVLLSTNKKHRYAIPLSHVNFNHSHTLTVRIPAYNKWKHQLNILNGTYYMYFYLYVHSQMHQYGVRLSELCVHLIDGPYHTLVNNVYDSVQYKTDKGTHLQFVLKIKQSYTGWDSRKSCRAVDYSLLYPMMRWLPLKKNLVLFDAYWGHQFSSNEKAIYHYIQKHCPNIETGWILKNNQIYIDGTGERLRVNSLKYWYCLARAKYIFQNTNMRNRYYKVPGQIETETLHGTFLKHMGFDEPHFRLGSQKTQDLLARRINRWDYLLVPSDYMARIASHAFDYHKKILKFGFPRNDSLIYNNNTKYINKIKKQLKIPKSKKVVLYAPTYRKHDASFHLNLAKLHKQIGDNTILLVRLHYFVAHSHSFYQYPSFVRDVSDYPEINDLFLISDALITDYSSVMFDYAYLKRPMIFYPYDEKTYLNNKIRGTYLNYDKVMPGPIVHTQEALAKQINHLDTIKKYYHKQIVMFSKKFAQYGRKGDASKKVVNYVLNHHLGLTKKQLESYQNIEPDVFGHKLLHTVKINNIQSRLLNALGNALPKKNIIMFDSFFGTSYSDSPKYLYLYIKKHYPQFQLYWNVNSDDVPYFKKHHIPYVTRFSYHGIIKQAEAKYWITNARRPFRWTVPRGAKLLMTWHGTPLKTLAADVKHVTMPSNNARRYHKQVYNDNKRWSKLITPNMYSAHIMHHAFRMLNNQLIVTGYPRNDVLVRHRRDFKLQNQLKLKLHIPLHKKVILYAPTWRDNDYIKSDEFVAKLHLNLDEMKKHYGSKAIVLVRTHYMIANHLNLNKFGNFVKDVSDYPDIDDLYLISDALITDYSSVMFDYSILERPIIFFDYDLKNYAKNTRGFYFDFRKIAPGPIVSTTNGVIHELDKIFSHPWSPSKQYIHFVKKFDEFEDGHNCKRVVEQLFNNDNVIVKHYNHYPKSISLHDGALLWNNDLDLTDKYAFMNGANYNQLNDQTFKIFDSIHLYSKSWNQPLGHTFYKIFIRHHPVWCCSIDTSACK